MEGYSVHSTHDSDRSVRESSHDSQGRIASLQILSFCCQESGDWSVICRYHSSFYCTWASMVSVESVALTSRPRKELSCILGRGFSPQQWLVMGGCLCLSGHIILCMDMAVLFGTIGFRWPVKLLLCGVEHSFAVCFLLAGRHVSLVYCSTEDICWGKPLNW